MAQIQIPVAMETKRSTNNDDDGRTKCLCQDFNSMTKIVDILNSKEQVDCLIRWLEGETDDLALKHNNILSCGKRSRCRFRYGTSFAILNAIRDACRPYLESQTSVSTYENGAKTPPEPVTVIYEDSFPALKRNKEKDPILTNKPHPAASNILIPRKKSKEQKVEPVVNTLTGKKNKAKKRIRPQPATSIEPNDSVWGKPSTTLGCYHGNIANLPSQNPLTPLKNIPVTPDNKSTFETKYGANGTQPKRLFVEESAQKSSTLSSTTLDINTNPVTNVGPEKVHNGSNTAATAVIEAPEYHLERLVEIYVTLIRSMLIPSTPLELHLLLRLLAIDPATCLRERFEDSSSTVTFFQPIFSTPERCKVFAALTLSKLKYTLQNMGFPLIKPLLQCGPFLKNCPDLGRDLNLLLEERTRQGLRAPEDTIGIHAILSLPFEQERDSRHNYRTQAEMAVYKNREQSRDAFLYQLRSYMNEKGKGFQAQDMETAKERLREESRRITSSLFTVNMPWFAQFFCDLLLQVGLSPVEETDQELLNIANKEKLQRLHKRFSSRSSHANKSSKKLVLSKRPDSASLSPLAEAQADFPGYQELFFIFLHSADNYNLGIHLRNRMVATILDLSSNHSTTHLEKRMMDLQLLARFLGFLIFSPNWHDTGIDLEKLNHDPKVAAISNGLHQLESLGLSTGQLVERSWENGFSVMVIPWITELLKMAKWDSLSLISRKFRQVMSNLRTIQRLAIADEEAMKRFGPSMQLVSFYLESFFSKAIGLPKLTSLPKSNLPSSTEITTDSLDVAAVGFSTAAMFASSSHVEDMSNLINRLNRAPIGKSPSKARKLRPSIVSRGLSLEQADRLFRESPVKRLSASNWQSSSSPGWSESASNKNLDIQKKLEDAFFHQHRGLRDVCDFAVSQVIKNAVSHEALNVFTKEALQARMVGLDSSEKDLNDARARAVELSNEFLRRSLENSVRASLTALGPSSLQPKVLDVAVSLAVARGMQSGQTLLHALVLNESKTFLDALKREEKKRLPSKMLTFAKEEQGLDEVLFSLKAVQSYLSENPSSSWDREEIVRRIQSALDSVTTFESSQNSMPPELTLREVFEVLFQLDTESVSLLKWSLSLTDRECFSVLPIFLRLETEVSKVTSYGLKHVSKCIDLEFLRRLIDVWPDSLDAVEQMALLLKDMVRARIIKASLLRECLDEDVDPRLVKVQDLLEAKLR